MPRQVTTGLYEFDPTMSKNANRIVNEKHAIYSPERDDFHFFIPLAAPFFVGSITVKNDTTGEVYEEGKDYLVGHWFVEAMTSTGRPVAGSIRFMKREIAGIISIDYHTLGGEWGYDNAAILRELSNKTINPLVRAWAQVDTLPFAFPPTPHDQRVDDLIGWEEVTESLEKIVTAIEESETGQFTEHMEDYNNPHKVTKDQVGLGSVQNYIVASETHSRQMVSRTHYMTPQATGWSIDEFWNTQLKQYFDGTVINPTHVTAEQIGLGNVPNYRIATDDEAINSDRNDLFMTPYLVKLAVGGITAGDVGNHIYRTDNPHNVTPAQIGAVSRGEFDDRDEYYKELFLEADEEAYDAARVFGMDYAALQQSILNGTAYDSERFAGRDFESFLDELSGLFVDNRTYPIGYVDPESVPEEHRWFDFFHFHTGDSAIHLTIVMAGVERPISLVEVQISLGGSFSYQILNGVTPVSNLAWRTHPSSPNMVSLSVDLLGLFGLFTVIPGRRLNPSANVFASDVSYITPNGDHVILTDNTRPVKPAMDVYGDLLAVKSDVSSLNTTVGGIETQVDANTTAINQLIDELAQAFDEAANQL